MRNIRRTLCAGLILLTGCTSVRESAQKAVDEYNTKAQEYGTAVEEYNSSVKQRNESVKELQTELDSCQASINKQEEPFDPKTLVNLKQEMTAAQDKLVAETDLLPEFETMKLTDSMTDNDLEAITEQVKADLTTMQETEIPEPVENVDYSEILPTLKQAHEAYDDSVQSLKQITAPSDEFVMERLSRIENITAIDHVTEENDPNGKLNKAGGYIGTIYYTDTQVDRSKLYLGDGDDVISVGTDGGGAVEIYPDKEGAEKRNAYLETFDGTAFDSGAHHVYGTIIIRISDELTATQQNEMTEKVLNALIEIDK